MSSPAMHPRRRPQKADAPSLHTMSLRKSNTYNARIHQASSPVEQSRYLPRRSPTCTKTLEDLIPQESAPTRHDHVAKLLQEFDDKISGRKPAGGDGSILKEQEVLAVPTFMVQQTFVPDLMDVDQKEAIADHHHDSDSGLGSSVGSSIGIVDPNNNKAAASTTTITNDDKEHNTRRSARTAVSISSTNTAITRSASTIGAAPQSEHFLSKEAIRHIKKEIVQPILNEDTLKDFHPLVEDIPRRIGAKFISNLRDLEKTLFFLAPVSDEISDALRAVAYALRDIKDFAPSPQSFLKFCETSIECLHTTVDLIPERDQRRDTDRPYTNNYFLDLVEQIRRYAEIMARTRERQATGQALDEMDYSPDEEIAIEGGLSKNGKPAELVRKKDGKVIPLSERSALEEPSPTSFKRQLTEDDMDDDVYRSMARRRKSEKPGDVMHSCRACDKEFKRPCDLTKHEKTHSRPWKCPNTDCKYFEHGWPTEKERDRHVNDKHVSAPKMYKCLFEGCTYSSKRESNCKQHMEKSHGWTYVRSKSNGRPKKSVAGSETFPSPSEPLTPFIATPASAFQQLTSPESNFMASPPMPTQNNFNFGTYGYTPGLSTEDLFDFNTRRESVATTGSMMTFSSNSNFSPAQPNMNSAFEDALSPELKFDAAMFDNAGLDANFMMPVQQLTPPLSINGGCDSGFAMQLVGQQHLSPAGQDLTLFQPQAGNGHFDEALGDELSFGQDFTLFDTSSNTSAGAQNSTNFFPDMGTIGGQFDHFGFTNSNFEDLFHNQQ